MVETEGFDLSRVQNGKGFSFFFKEACEFFLDCFGYLPTALVRFDERGLCWFTRLWFLFAAWAWLRAVPHVHRSALCHGFDCRYRGYCKFAKSANLPGQFKRTLDSDKRLGRLCRSPTKLATVVSTGDGELRT